MSLTIRTVCRGCGGELREFLSLGEQPLGNRLRKAHEPAEVPRFPLTLCHCTVCDLAQLREVVDPAVLFADYAYVPSTSSTMRAHFDTLAASACERLSLGRGDLVVDVGSNDGLLLSSFQRRGVDVLGIEPAEGLAARANAAGIPTANAFFGEAMARTLPAAGRASLVTATNVFAHVDDVRGFTRAAFTLLKRDGVFVVEVQSFADTVSSLAFDMTYHEHMTYWSTASLRHMCRIEGLDLLDVERVETHGGSLRAVIGRAGHPLAHPERVEARIAAERGRVGAEGAARLAAGATTVRRQLQELIGSVRRGGGRIAAYGAPAKATVLLNYCGFTDRDVEWVADKNVDKQGHFIPGVNIPVVAPSRIAATPPTHLLLLAWNLAPEIMQEQAAFGDAGGRYLVPFPEPREISPPR